VLAQCRNPVVIITKNELVTRDIDLLGRLAEHQAALVLISVTSLKPELARDLEPRASQPARRLAAIEALAKAGIPVGVLTAPVIPGLTDHEMPAILVAAARAGAITAGYVPLRLPYGVSALFEEWLELHAPGEKAKILNRVRSMRDGRLNDPNFSSRMRGSGAYAEHMKQLFEISCRKAGLDRARPELSAANFRPPPTAQLELFSQS
jgi:DNA repair photolyase